jgi:uncharacterized protein YsxB (DUF464 family)
MVRVSVLRNIADEPVSIYVDGHANEVITPDGDRVCSAISVLCKTFAELATRNSYELVEIGSGVFRWRTRARLSDVEKARVMFILTAFQLLSNSYPTYITMETGYAGSTGTGFKDLSIY